MSHRAGGSRVPHAVMSGQATAAQQTQRICHSSSQLTPSMPPGEGNHVQPRGGQEGGGHSLCSVSTILDVNKIYERLKVKMLTIQLNCTERRAPWNGASREGWVVSESQMTGELLTLKGIPGRRNQRACPISWKTSLGGKKERRKKEKRKKRQLRFPGNQFKTFYLPLDPKLRLHGGRWSAGCSRH